MGRTLRVCAIQLKAHDRATFESGDISIDRTVEDAARSADLLVLPEGTFPAYVLGDDDINHRQVTSAIDALREIARRHECVVVAGAAVKREARLYNSAVVIDADGTVAGTAEKLFLWHFDRKWFAPGGVMEPIATRAGTLGVMICADGRMPGIGQHLVDRGAELLVMPTAWVTSGRNPEQLENIQADLLARVRAYENGVPFVAANKCGTEMGIVAYCGKSQIVDGHGRLLALASQHDPETVFATVELGAAAPHREAQVPVEPVEPLSGTARIAFALEPLDDEARMLGILDANELLTPASPECIEGESILDPRTLVRYRAAGRRRVLVRTHRADADFQNLARARAAELRLYLFVFDLDARRAYAVDPDGTIVAGTFDGLRVASLGVDYRRTNETFVAPGTDVERGLADIAAIAAEVSA